MVDTITRRLAQKNERDISQTNETVDELSIKLANTKNELVDKIDRMINPGKFPFTWEDGYLNKDGVKKQAGWGVTSLINSTDKNCVAKITNKGDFTFAVQIANCTENGGLIGFSTIVTVAGGETKEIAFNGKTATHKFKRFVCRKEPLSVITTEEISSIFSNMTITDVDAENSNLTDYWNVKHTTISSRILSDEKKIAKRDNIIIVDKNGNGDYTTVQEAVNHAKNFDTIFIRKGEYEESIILQYGQHLYFIGEDKHKTVIYNTTGDYNTPPLWAVCGTIENLTLYAKRDESKDYTNLSKFAYGLHLDTKFPTSESNRTMEIKNCIIISDFNDAIGAGTASGTIYDIHDCIIKSNADACSAFKCHIGANQGQSYIILKNNVLMNTDTPGAFGILLHHGNITEMGNVDVLCINNAVKSYVNTTTVMTLNEYSYGNSLPSLNKFTVN